jgi:hypothetical protein
MFRISGLHTNAQLPESAPFYLRFPSLFLLCDQLNCSSIERGEYNPQDHEGSINLFLQAKQLEGWSVDLAMILCPGCAKLHAQAREQMRRQSEAAKKRQPSAGPLVSLHSEGDLRKMKEAAKQMEQVTGRKVFGNSN